MTAKEVSSARKQFAHTPPAVLAVDDARTAKIRPLAAVVAVGICQGHILLYGLPVAATLADAIIENDTTFFGAKSNL